MFLNLKPANIFFLSLSIAAGIAGLAFSDFFQPIPHPSPLTPQLSPHPSDDTVKYRGFRLDLTNFEVVKRTDDWVRVRFTVINSGRMDVDFSKKGTEHWVQINFDPTLFDNKLGGLRDNLRQALYDDNFVLAAGKIQRDKELKVPVVLLQKPGKPEEKPAGFATIEPAEKESVEAGFAAKGGEEEPVQPSAESPNTPADCPDIFFNQLRIVEQDDKSATVEYTIENKGQGIFKLFEKGSNSEEKLVVKAYISGVPVLSRGALPLGGQMVKAQSGQSGDLLPGDTYSGRMRLDVRKKTRYMKSLILSLDSDQFKFECDKTNNTGAVILD
ncbi:MAG: hypothetical protein HY842_04820 [Bacteroidetes bacterium]|nr:hypothetical protein [Bacteroidota bacterium]